MTILALVDLQVQVVSCCLWFVDEQLSAISHQKWMFPEIRYFIIIILSRFLKLAL